MPNDAVIQVRVDAKTKKRAEKLFKRHGLTTSDGVRILLNQALEEKTMPHVPNAETQKAIEEARAGGGEVVSLSELRKLILGKS